MNHLCRIAVAVLGLLGTDLAAARTLQVGPQRQYKQPSEAIAAAQDGDTVQIDPGVYFDCSVVKQNRLTIAGAGPDTVLTDKICQGKALLVIDGNDVTVRNLTLRRARAPDQNGAGIRAEGGNLTVEKTRFLNNENGLISADNPEATIRVIDSEFVGNGKCPVACAHAIYASHIALLRVERSRFSDTREGHHIKSRALRTEIVGNDIADGPTGTASYLIDVPNGGSLIVNGNTLEKGPHSSNPSIAINIGEEGVDRPTDEIIVRDNTFINDEGRGTTLLNNVTATPADLSGNRLKGEVRPLVGDGSSR
jgi:hypothetical protein